MAFRRKRAQWDVEIVGLIDLIFLLLIFFLVLTSRSAVGVQTGLSSLILPLLSGSEATDKVSTLTIYMGYAHEEQEVGPPEILYALLPPLTSGGYTSTLTFAGAQARAKEHPDLHWPSPSAWPAETQEDFLERIIRTYGHTPPTSELGYIEIVAVAGTPYGHIGRIMSICREPILQDCIKNLVFRTRRP